MFCSEASQLCITDSGFNKAEKCRNGDGCSRLVLLIKAPDKQFDTVKCQSIFFCFMLGYLLRLSGAVFLLSEQLKPCEVLGGLEMYIRSDYIKGPQLLCFIEIGALKLLNSTSERLTIFPF